MNTKTLVTILLLGFVVVSVAVTVVSEYMRGSQETVDGQTVEQGSDESNARLTVYYFHGNKRCTTCRTIEAYGKEAIESGYAEALVSGLVEWKVVNVDEPQHEHFIEDFELANKSIVVAENLPDATGRWKRLDRVWDLVGDRPGFIAYVQGEVGTLLEPAG